MSLLFWKLDRDWKFNRRSLGKKGNFPFSNNYSSSRKIYDKIRFVNNNRGRGTEENEKKCRLESTYKDYTCVVVSS